MTRESGTPVSLVALLEHHFQSGALAPAACRVASSLPKDSWERALLGPAREFLKRPGKQFRAQLVASSWALADGEPGALPAELPLVVELLHAGSLIVDDIQDQSDTRRGGPALHRLYGIPVALNTGNWLYFWSLVVLGRTLPQDQAAAIHLRASETLMHCHQGQALDLAARVCDLVPAEVRRAVAVTTGLKTGALTEFAAVLGASAASASPARRDALGRFGHRVGVGLQMLDDLGCLVALSRRAKALEDLRLLRLTWPWAWLAERVDPGRFARWQRQARQAAEAAEASACTAFLDGLAGEIADLGRERVSRHLAGALEDLASRLGPSPHLDQVERELTRLEKSYG